MKSTIKSLLIITILVLFMSITVDAKVPSWVEAGKIIHAGGGIGNSPYTNSANALNNTLKKNERVVELDFAFTKDGVLVCTHSNVKNKTSKAFLSKKVKGKYKSMTAKSALKRLIKSKNTYLVVDAKEKDITKVYKEINSICKSFGTKGKKYRKMIIPQLYTKSDYKKVKRVYHYKNYIFSMYKLKKKDFKSVSAFCKKSGINTVTIPKGYITPEVVSTVKEYGLTVATHTVNDEMEYETLKQIGIDVIYTDFLYD